MRRVSVFRLCLLFAFLFISCLYAETATDFNEITDFEMKTPSCIIQVGNSFYTCNDDSFDNLYSTVSERIVWNIDAIDEFVKCLSERFNEADTERCFKTHDGEVISYNCNDFGWVVDEEKTIKNIKRSILKNDNFIELAWSDGRIYDPDNNVGGEYIEVSIRQQMVYYYKNYELLLSSPCVTGNADGSRDSDKGLFRVYYKQSPATLRGADYSSDVTYWMPYNGGEGLHDATWRNSFGGDIYTYDGSHGCINLPLDAAEFLYNHIEEGCPVVVY